MLSSSTIRFSNLIKKVLFFLAKKGKYGRAIIETHNTQTPIDFRRWFSQHVMGVNLGAYWPMDPSSTVSYAKRIRIGVETSPGWSSGCMIHGVNGIYIGDYTQISQNVAILSGNHDPYDLVEQIDAPPIVIGQYCLLGFGCVILPGVALGDYTIVAANSVVTKSFPDGYQVIAGTPAKAVKRLDPEKAANHKSKHEYHGYIKKSEFLEFEKNHLKLLGNKK